MSKREIPLLEGHFYHIYNRGNNGENLFIEEHNYLYFLQLYSHHIFPIADTYTYCLMRNHFHLLIRIQPKNLNQLPIDYSKQFSNLFNAYTRTINKTYHRTGSLFERPFKRILVNSDSYFTQLICYIHRNPQKHGFTDDFRTYPYSSYPVIQQQKLTRLKSQQVIDWFSDMHAFEEYHRQSNENSIQHLVKDDFH